MTHDPTREPLAQEVRMPCGNAWVYGDLTRPQEARGLVLLVHSGAGGRHSALHRHAAAALQEAGVATLLFGLLTVQEEELDAQTRAPWSRLALLTRRLQDATDWAHAQSALRQMPLGYFGAGTGSAAALIAAARLGRRIHAVVCCDGRPDLAGPVALAAITAPTLLVAEAGDTHAVTAARQAYASLRSDKRLEILSDKHPAHESAARQAAGWFAPWLADDALARQGELSAHPA